MNIQLKRVAFSPVATFGVLILGNIPFALTGERQWKDNESRVSCIPAGIYKCAKIHSPHFGEVVQVLDVPNRTHILFHKGNVPFKDSEGCILVGEQFEPLGGDTAVLASKKGFTEFMSLVPDAFTLEITDA